VVDLLADAAWECAPSRPGAIDGPHGLDAADLEWIPATVPGTAAGALRAAGRWTWGHDDEAVLDGQDWWWRTTADLDAAPAAAGWVLDAAGLATLADVWVGDDHVVSSDNMFLAHRADLAPGRSGPVPVVLRCAALAPRLTERRPRPRWRTRLDRSQNQRWFRTSLLGRNDGWTSWAAPVGPWGALTLRAVDVAPVVVSHRLHTSVAAGTGTVRVEVLVRSASPPAAARVHVGDVTVAADLVTGDDGARITAVVTVAAVERWWPHTHGPQPRYDVTVVVDGTEIGLGRIGFRDVGVDTSDGGFTVEVNGTAVFCRGACWSGPDAVSLAPDPASLRRALEAVRDAGMNMLRIGGYTVYESDTFWDLCDELGLLVWQDCMLAAFDPPEDPAWLDSLDAEVAGVFARLGGHPSLAVICGSSETHQQAAMVGLAPGGWASPALDERIPATAARLLPGVPYVASTPTGGDLPFFPDRGIGHYFGVGAYLRPPDDARSAGVRFAAECLAFGTPPERAEVDRVFGGAARAGHDPLWKLAVARDVGTSWDFEDVRDHYVRTLFGVDPLAERYEDPEHALDLGRAAVVELMTAAMAGWRRPGSACAGALVLAWQDLWPGAGWGLRDAGGVAKAPWYGLARVLAPVAVTVTDDGLAGLRIQDHNDRPGPVAATLELEVTRLDGGADERGEMPVTVGPGSAVEHNAVALLGGFRDLNRAYRFGPAAHDAAIVTLRGADGSVLADAVHLCAGPARPREADVGLAAVARPAGDGWVVEVTTERLAQYVVAEITGGSVTDAWFHLPPGRRRVLPVTLPAGRTPTGTVRALNSRVEVPVTVDEQPEERTE
jgi:beta-mannosidase